MKNKFRVKVLGLLIPFMMATTASADPIVNFTIDGTVFGSGGSATVTAGEIFTVDVTLAGNVVSDGDLADYGFGVGLSSGAPFTYNGYTVSAAYTQDLGGEAGFVGGLLEIPSSITPGDDITLATLSILAGDSGAGVLSISGLFSGTFYGAYFTQFPFWKANYDIVGNLNLTIEPAPVPEPATMLLFGTGLAGLAGVSRRKKQLA